MRLLFFWIIVSFTTAQVQAQKPAAKKTEEVKIITSAQCEMCKKRIEKALYKVKGVVSATLNVETKTVSVVYRTNKINVEALRKAINRTGYDADDSPADADAYSKLPECCQKGGSKMHRE